MRFRLGAVMLAIALSACQTTEPTSYNAGSWMSAALPSGSTTTFSLDSSGTSLRGAGLTTGIVGHGQRPFTISGQVTLRQLALRFVYRDGTSYDYLARYDGPGKLVGSTSIAGTPLADSVIYLRR